MLKSFGQIRTVHRVCGCHHPADGRIAAPKLYGFHLKNTTKWFIYSQQYRQDAIKDAQVLRSRGEQVELMPLTEQNTKAVYEKYAEENHIQDIIFYM